MGVFHVFQTVQMVPNRSKRLNTTLCFKTKTDTSIIKAKGQQSNI